MARRGEIYAALEKISRKWWFFLIMFMMFFIPPYSTVKIDPTQIPEITIAVLSKPLIYSFSGIFPVFKIAPIILIILLVVLKNRAVRAFDTYVAVLSFGFATLQTAAFTERYGFAVLSGSFIVYLIVAFFWVVEVLVKKNEITGTVQPWWRYWVVPFAFFSFWYPINSATLSPDFSPLALLTSESGLTYCMMTPVFLSIVTLFFSRVNRATVRVAGFAGTVTGLFNVSQILLHPYALWMGVLHIPLFVVSIYAFVISFSRNE
jgi:hypothetical protein